MNLTGEDNTSPSQLVAWGGKENLTLRYLNDSLGRGWMDGWTDRQKGG